MDDLEKEFLELINKVKDNLRAQYDAGEIHSSVFNDQTYLCDQLIDGNSSPGWNSSGCSWDSSSVC